MSNFTDQIEQRRTLSIGGLITTSGSERGGTDSVGELITSLGVSGVGGVIRTLGMAPALVGLHRVHRDIALLD